MILWQTLQVCSTTCHQLLLNMQTLEKPTYHNSSAAKQAEVAAPTPNKTQASKPRFGRWVAVAGVVVVGALAVGIVPRLHARHQLASEMRDLAVATVNVVSPVTEKASSLLTLPAEIRPQMEAPIFARANGYLKNFRVDIGSKVAAGDLLAEIDMPELDQEIQSSAAELKRAEAALELAKTTAARWSDLRKTDSVSEQEFAEKNADLALKSATADAARANLGRLEQLKNFSRVTAPFAGTITARNADVGDLVSANSSRELFHLAALDKLRVFVNVPQNLAPKVTVGSTAELIPTESRSTKFTAKVVRAAGAISAASRTMLTELEVNNSRGQILAGSYAQVVFTELDRDMPLVVPSNTMIYRADGAQVALVTPENKIELRHVETGRDFGRTIEVL
ncbi:MAG TPA: efflux RND transporter periplasmic adaptor subunit, partial [Verrucomicrobiae bacterium]